MADQRPAPTDAATTMSIRQPNSGPRGPRLLPPTHATHAPDAVTPPVRPARGRPDPSALRVIIGVLGMASAAALTSAMLPSITPEPVAQDAGTVAVAAVQPEPSVRHVTRYVTLKPGQTAPPQSTVIVRPKPTPIVKVKVVTRTRQSGKP
jgi:hypothetical protein